MHSLRIKQEDGHLRIGFPGKVDRFFGSTYLDQLNDVADDIVQVGRFWFGLSILAEGEHIHD